MKLVIPPQPYSVANRVEPRPVANRVARTALIGFGFGVAAVIMHLAFIAFYKHLESISREAGAPPRIPLLEGDCELPKFRTEILCMKEPIDYYSLTTVLAAIIGTLVGFHFARHNP